MKDKKKIYTVPVSGSLSLFAQGAVGVRAWREKRDALKSNEPSNQKNRYGQE